MERFDKAYFDAGVPRVGTDSVKWDGMFAEMGDSVMIPMWVADMDFPSPPAVYDALASVLARRTWGYTLSGDADKQALCGFWKRRHGVDIDPAWVLASPCVVTGLKLAVRAAAKPGEGVLINTPVYGPFYASIRENGRRIVESPLAIDERGLYVMDLADMEDKLASGEARAVMLCSPHNPGGRAWTREELTAVASMCARHGATLICDEIHADFVYAPGEHVSVMSIEEAKGRRVMLCAASKTFNVAGLEQSAIVCDSEALREAIAADINASGVKAGNAFALAATRACYTDSDAWLEGLLAYLKDNRDAMMAFAAEHWPRVRVMPAQATYLMWIDCSALGLSQEELLERIHAVHVKVNDGLFFGERGRGFIRLNVGCPRAQLMEALERLKDVLA